MQKQFAVVAITAVLGVCAGPGTAVSAEKVACPAGDSACRAFVELAAAEQHEKIIAQVDPEKTYSAEARALIGQAYLMLAGRETNTPEQEEQFCLKALAYGATSAYMGLYFIHAGTDEGEALGYLRHYVATQPKDSVPYVILGESELGKNNAAAAAAYLREAKKVARGKSANLEWLLFQASYLSGDYATAAATLDSSLSQGKTQADINALISSDKRFANMHQRPEFGKFLSTGAGTSAAPTGGNS